MIIWICSDMEGLAGVDQWEQCYPEDRSAPAYQFAREQLTADANAIIAGCFDAGATEVRILDGHGYNEFRGFIHDRLDRRAHCVGIASEEPLRWEGLDGSVDAIAVIGQHAMAGTVNGFLDHTGSPKTTCRFLVNGVEHGELSRLAMYAGYFGIPLVYASGDEALCQEGLRLFPHIVTTPTKRGTGWETCQLYDVQKVRTAIRHDIAQALRIRDSSNAWRPPPSIHIAVEFAWSGLADKMARYRNVNRLTGRMVSWEIRDARDVFSWPSELWHPEMPGI